MRHFRRGSQPIRKLLEEYSHHIKLAVIGTLRVTGAAGDSVYVCCSCKSESKSNGQNSKTDAR
jgi:hypothetical protein